MSELVLKQNYTQTMYSRDFGYDLCEQYLLDHTKWEPTTLKGYKTCIHSFYEWITQKGIKNPTEQDIKRYDLYLKNANLTIGTKNQYIKAVKHLFKWLSKKGYYDNIADDLTLYKDSTRVKKDHFTEQDIVNILDKIDKNTIIGKRDYAIMLLAITGGLRASEIVNIDIRDKKAEHNVCKIFIKGKGHHGEKDDYIKVIKPINDAIQDYLDARGNYTPRDPLFVSTSNNSLNKRITKETLSQIFKQRFRDAGYDSDRLTLHSLRHSTATILLKASNNDLYRVQRHMRHQDPKTTEVYINLNDKEQDTAEQDIYNQIFDINKQKLINEIKENIYTMTENDLQDILKQIINKKGGIKND
jgi:integrase/recombinase XerC